MLHAGAREHGQDEEARRRVHFEARETRGGQAPKLLDELVPRHSADLVDAAVGDDEHLEAALVGEEDICGM